MAPRKSKKSASKKPDQQEENGAPNGEQHSEEIVNDVEKNVKETGKKAKREASKNGPANNTSEGDESEAPPSKKRSVANSGVESSRGTIKLRTRKPPPVVKTTPDKKVAKKKTSKKTVTKKTPKKTSKTPPKKTQFEVDAIIDVRNSKKGGKKEYLVRWKGYGSSDDTWEPEKNLKCPSLLQQFKEKNAKE